MIFLFQGFKNDDSSNYKADSRDIQSFEILKVPVPVIRFIYRRRCVVLMFCKQFGSNWKRGSED